MDECHKRKKTTKIQTNKQSYTYTIALLTEETKLPADCGLGFHPTYFVCHLFTSHNSLVSTDYRTQLLPLIHDRIVSCCVYTVTVFKGFTSYPTVQLYISGEKFVITWSKNIIKTRVLVSSLYHWRKGFVSGV